MTSELGSRHSPNESQYPSLSDFESANIDPGQFNHRAHVYVAWRYLQEFSLLDAVTRYSEALKRVTQKLGVPEKYHETITWFFMILIAEKLAEKPGANWQKFSAANPELCNEGGTVLRRFYSQRRLNSALAKQVFLVPDRLP